MEREVAFVLDDVAEAPRGVVPPVDVDEPNARLAHHLVLHLLQDAQLIEDAVAVRQERFTDVFTRELRTLEHQDAVPPFGQQGRHGRSGWAASDHEHI